VEDTASRAELADAGVVLSADVAGLCEHWSVWCCGGDLFGVSLGCWVRVCGGSGLSDLG